MIMNIGKSDMGLSVINPSLEMLSQKLATCPSFLLIIFKNFFKKSNCWKTNVACNFSSSSRSLIVWIIECFLGTSNPIFSHTPHCCLLRHALMRSTHVLVWESSSAESNLHSASQSARSSKSAPRQASETCQQSVAHSCVWGCVYVSLSPFAGWNHCGGTSNKVLSRSYLRVMISLKWKAKYWFSLEEELTV